MSPLGPSLLLTGRRVCNVTMVTASGILDILELLTDKHGCLGHSRTQWMIPEIGAFDPVNADV